MSNNIPQKITPDQYDKFMRELWEMRQKLSVLDHTTVDKVSIDELFEKQLQIDKKLLCLNLLVENILAQLTVLLKERHESISK